MGISNPTSNDDQEFTRLLNQFRDRYGVTNAEIRRRTGIDEAYLSRLFCGEKTRPSRDMVIRLGTLGLKVDQFEADELLLAAEFRPLVIG